MPRDTQSPCEGSTLLPPSNVYVRSFLCPFSYLHLGGSSRIFRTRQECSELETLLSQYTHFLPYLTNSTVCFCEWMACPVQSKSWALLCGFMVSHNDWRQPPKGEPCRGFILTHQCQETPNIPVRGEARDCQSMWTELSSLGHLFLVFLTIL